MGSSPAWPNPGSAQSGYVVEDGESRLLLDCGPGVLGRLRAERMKIDAVAITHFHLDHWGDLVPWAWLVAYGPADETARAELWLPPGGIRELDDFADRWGNPKMFEHAFDLHEFDQDAPFEAAGFTMRAQRLVHYTVQSFGFSVRDNHEGRLLAYSGDSAPCDELNELARGADLFLCEATLAAGENDSTPRGHLSADEAIEAADGRLLLTHRPVELAPPEGTQVAHDGLVVDV